MRILMISHAYPPTFGGVESHVWDVCHRLQDRGHDVLVLAGREHTDTPGRVPVHRHDALSVQTLLGGRVGLRADEIDPLLLADVTTVLDAELTAFAPDIVHVHNAHHFGPELAQALLARSPAPAINGVHDRVGEHLCPQVLDWPWALVVFASEYLRTALPTVRESAVRWLGIELESFRVDGPRDPRLENLPGPVVFHPARLLRWKGVECGVRAFAKVHAELGGSLVLCASDDIVDDPAEVAALRGELVELAGELGVGDAVHFMSFERDQMGDAYRAADLIWYPTIEEEPLGLVPLEAMACGTPLVVSRSGGMRETVDDGRTGLVVPRNDADALAAAAVEILTDGPLGDRLVDNGLAGAPRFGNEAYVDWLEESYRTVLAGR